MNLLKTTGACIFSYLAAATLLFGGPLKPLFFLTFLNDRPALMNWPVFIVIGSTVGFVCAILCVRLGMNLRYAPATFVFSAMICATAGFGVYLENKRSDVIDGFHPDVSIRNSFFKSIRSVPQDFQFFLHGAALKDCIPYAWSYRDMAFYQLPPNVAVNVLPPSWVEACRIQRTR